MVIKDLIECMKLLSRDEITENCKPTGLIVLALERRDTRYNPEILSDFERNYMFLDEL